MPEILVVFDTHILIDAITHSNQIYENAFNVMIEKDNNNKLLTSTRIIKQYQTIMHKNGFKITALLEILRYLEEIKKVKNISITGIKQVSIRGLQTNDRPFVELACDRAKYLVTNDPYLIKKYTEFKKKCRFEVTYAENYVESESH
jgi:predicted nucleic acid-binding protein